MTVGPLAQLIKKTCPYIISKVKHFIFGPFNYHVTCPPCVKVLGPISYHQKHNKRVKVLGPGAMEMYNFINLVNFHACGPLISGPYC